MWCRRQSSHDGCRSTVPRSLRTTSRNRCRSHDHAERVSRQQPRGCARITLQPHVASLPALPSHQVQRERERRDRRYAPPHELRQAPRGHPFPSRRGDEDQHVGEQEERYAKDGGGRSVQGERAGVRRPARHSADIWRVDVRAGRPMIRSCRSRSLLHRWRGSRSRSYRPRTSARRRPRDRGAPHQGRWRSRCRSACHRA